MKLSTNQVGLICLKKKSRLKCINYGVGGYGIDQAVLSYKYSNINTKYVILGVISGDFERATQILYKGIYHGGTKSKPMFDFSDENKVKIINQPALYGNELIEEFKKGTESTFLKSEKSYNKKILEFDFFDYSYIYRVFKMFWLRKEIVKSPIYLNEKEQEDNFNYIMKILVYFKNIAIEKEAIPIVVIMGNSNSFNDRNSILKPWKEFKDGLNDIGIKYIDTSDSLYYHYKKSFISHK